MGFEVSSALALCLATIGMSLVLHPFFWFEFFSSIFHYGWHWLMGCHWPLATFQQFLYTCITYAFLWSYSLVSSTSTSRCTLLHLIPPCFEWRWWENNGSARAQSFFLVSKISRKRSSFKMKIKGTFMSFLGLSKIEQIHVFVKTVV